MLDNFKSSDYIASMDSFAQTLAEASIQLDIPIETLYDMLGARNMILSLAESNMKIMLMSKKIEEAG